MQRTLSSSLSGALLHYYFHVPNHPLKIRLFSWLHRLMGRPRFTMRFAGRAWITLDIDDFIQFEILKTGDFEPDVWRALAEHAVAGEVVWDVGANVGSVSLSAATCPAVAEVHCFEPNPAIFPALAQNIRLNPQFKIVGHAFAMGDRSEVRALFQGADTNSGSAGFSPHWSDRSEPVRCLTGDQCVAEGICPLPTLVKIDVEGFELQVLRGMEGILRNHPPKAILFEGHLGENGQSNSQPVIDYLAGLGFECALEGRRDVVVNYLAKRKAA